MDIEKELKEIQILVGDILVKIVAILTDVKHKMPIEELGLSTRAMRWLERQEIEYVEQIPQKRSELLRICGIGVQTADEIMGTLSPCP